MVTLQLESKWPLYYQEALRVSQPNRFQAGAGLLVEPILSVKPEIPYFRQTLSLCSSSGVWGGGCSGTVQNKLALSLEFFLF